MAIAIRGLAMGIAEVIPGVSGGTIAFITGIYTRLLGSIKAVGPELITAYRAGGIRQAWIALDGGFLVALLLGMAGGIVIGIFGISWLIEHYPMGIWSFFFGLIAGSAVLVARTVSEWKLPEWFAIILATGLAFYITIASPANGSESLIAIFVSGFIAISAMILPGISGSFLLLLMGMYALIIGNVKGLITQFGSNHFLVVSVFAAGCMLGLATSARILTWVFKHYHNTAMAILTGFMIGSLNRLWPWKTILSYRINSKGEQIPFLDKSVLPVHFEGDPQYIMVSVCLVAGILTVLWISKMGRTGGTMTL